MAGDKRQPGQRWRPPRADEINAWNETAEHRQRWERLGEKIPDSRVPVHVQLSIIKVKNLTGTNLKRGSVVEVGAALFDDPPYKKPTRVHPWFEGVTLSSRCKRYAVCSRSLRKGRIGDATTNGPTFALVDITKGDKRCSPRKDLTHFLGDTDGPVEILWKPKDASSGVHECLVELEQEGPPTTYVAKLPGEGIPAREGDVVGSAECEIYKLPPIEDGSCGTVSLQPVILPDGSTLKKCVRNVSGTVLSGKYALVHRDECGNWMVDTKGTGRIVFTLQTDRTRERVGGLTVGHANAVITDFVGIIGDDIGDVVEVVFGNRRWLEAVKHCQGIADYIDGKYIVTECQGLPVMVWAITDRDRTAGAPTEDVEATPLFSIGHAQDDLPIEERYSQQGPPDIDCGSFEIEWNVATQNWDIVDYSNFNSCCGIGWSGEPAPEDTQTPGQRKTITGPFYPTQACDPPPESTGFKVRFYQDTYPAMLKGALVLCVLDNQIKLESGAEDNIYWAMISDQIAHEITAPLNANMCGTAATFDDFIVESVWPFSQKQPNRTTASNPKNHYGQVGDSVSAFWSQSALDYIVHDVSLKAVTIPVNLRSEVNGQGCTEIKFDALVTPLEYCSPASEQSPLLSYKTATLQRIKEIRFEKNQSGQSGSGSGVQCAPTLEIDSYNETALVTCNSPANETTATLTLAVEAVMREIAENGDCLHEVFADLVVFGQCGTDTQADAFLCKQDCPTGSGSGSGSG